MTPEEQAALDAANKSAEEAKSSAVDVNTEESKAIEKAKNLDIALKQEREKSKAIADKLAEYEAKEKAIEEKKALEKGKHEELIQQLKSENETLKQKATAFEELQAKITQEKTTKYESLIATIPDDLKTKYSTIADKLDLDDKIALFEGIASDIKKPDYTQKPSNEGDAKPNNFDIIAEKLKKGERVSPSETADYLQHLRKQQ